MSNFIEMKVGELAGAALDWAVAVAGNEEPMHIRDSEPRLWNEDHSFGYSPSTDWEQGGPLVEKYKPWLTPPVRDPDPEEPYGWDAEIYDAAGHEVIGQAIGCPTALVAVCRAVVLAQLGPVVSVPAELVGGDE